MPLTASALNHVFTVYRRGPIAAQSGAMAGPGLGEVISSWWGLYFPQFRLITTIYNKQLTLVEAHCLLLYATTFGHYLFALI